jgi:nicotinate phosphoribosyltransferase
MGIPVFGTMAHSFVQFFDEELEAFKSFQKVFPNDTTIVVDTYDSIEGVKKALQLGSDFHAIRLDSGDLGELAVEARRLLDEAGRKDVRIFASGNLNEQKLHSLALADAPIDGFGLGTDLVVSADAPTCDFVYKLVEVERGGLAVPKFKTSENKLSLPFRKQVFRVVKDTAFVKDVVGRWDERCEIADYKTVPTLERVVKNGKLVGILPSIVDIRQRTRQQISMLPGNCRRLRKRANYPVEFTSAIREAVFNPGTEVRNE